MIYKCTNAYYFNTLSAIGGIESHFYYMAKKYGEYDIVFFYRKGDPKQVSRIRKYARCYQINNDDFLECDVLFCCFNREILDQCKAKKKYLILHGDYKDMVERKQLDKEWLPIDDRVDGYLGVSQSVCDSWYEMTGIKAQCVYQPVVFDKKDKPLLFISATRLTPEKGWSRMQKLANELDKNNVNYLWYIFTNSAQEPLPNMIFCYPRLDITDKLELFDAFIQLSDNEGYCLSVAESLSKGVPVICTDLPVFRELGLNNSNSIKIDFDMSNIPIDRIRNIRDLKFKFKVPEDYWLKYIKKKKSNYKGANMKVRAITTYYDLELRDQIKEGSIIDVDENRAKRLVDKGVAEIIKENKYETKSNKKLSKQSKDL